MLFPYTRYGGRILLFVFSLRRELKGGKDQFCTHVSHKKHVLHQTRAQNKDFSSAANEVKKACHMVKSPSFFQKGHGLFFRPFPAAEAKTPGKEEGGRGAERDLKSILRPSPTPSSIHEKVREGEKGAERFAYHSSQ